MLDENYRPAGILTAYEANSKQSLIMRSVAAGLLPPFGIHYQNLFNANNLADDLIEPFRPSLDLIAYNIKADNIQLSREERKQLVSVLLHAVHIGEEKVSILKAIDMLISQYRSYVLEECEEVDLPQILPIEIIKQIKE